MIRLDWRIAIIVDPSLPPGLLANTVATIAIGIGAAEPSFGNATLVDAVGRNVRNSADRPVPVLAADADKLRALLLKAVPAPEETLVVPFPAFARSIHTFAAYQALFPTRDLAAEPLEGLGLAGPDKWVRALTGSFRLLR